MRPFHARPVLTITEADAHSVMYVSWNRHSNTYAQKAVRET
jgi:hypothetical protein